MTGNGVQRQVTEVAEAICARTDELAVDLARAITREVRLYQSAPPVPFETVTAGCAANMRPIFTAMATDADFDTAAATELGAERARDGVPLSSVMEAYRVGFRRVWDAVVSEAETRARVNGEAVRALTAKLLAAQDTYTDAMAASYREEHDRRLRGDESERAVLIDALLHGRLFDRWSVWEAADYLRLPTTGPFVAVAADVPAVGAQALPNVESKLRGIEVYSAWHLLPDLQAGIVHIKTDQKLSDVVALLSRMARTRVGVSARFDDLRETAQALRYARVMLRGQADPDQLVRMFDGSILASAAVSAPEVMVKLAAPIVECFAAVADNEREVLFTTFKTWLDNDGSLRDTGELMFCHPNTVRYRLHRIEQRTGRSLSCPRDIAELSLAFEVQRRLM
jgi:hypothetical protein